jgi:hypothetical protein
MALPLPVPNEFPRNTTSGMREFAIKQAPGARASARTPEK